MLRSSGTAIGTKSHGEPPPNASAGGCRRGAEMRMRKAQAFVSQQTDCTLIRVELRKYAIDEALVPH